MNYTDFTTAISSLLAMTDAKGQEILGPLWPRMIEAAELMMYRDPDLDWLATRKSDATNSSILGSRVVPIPTSLVVLEGASVITPVGQAFPYRPSAQRIVLLRTSREFCDTIWPVESLTKPPVAFETYYAAFDLQEDPSQALGDEPTPNNPSSIIIAPTLDASYFIEFTGTFRPAPLSVVNPTTFISTYLPDLMISAAMIWATGAVLRNFGAQADNPQQAMSWKSLYDLQKTGAAVESARQKAASAGQTAFPPAGLTSMQRPAAPPPMIPPPGR